MPQSARIQEFPASLPATETARASQDARLGRSSPFHYQSDRYSFAGDVTLKDQKGKRERTSAMFTIHKDTARCVRRAQRRSSQKQSPIFLRSVGLTCFSEELGGVWH